MGLFDFVSDWRRKLIDEPIDRKMRQSLDAGVAMAKELVAKRTHYLESTIGSTYDQSQKLGILYADAPYAAAQEEGTIYMRAHPYLRPALNAMGRPWGGGTQISYLNAYALSGKKGPAHIARHNAETSAQLHRGASGRARVRYQGGRATRQSRTKFRLWLNAPSPNDPTTPIL